MIGRGLALVLGCALLAAMPAAALAVDPTPTPAPTASPAPTPTPAPNASPAPTAAPAPTPTSAPPGPTPLGTTVTFYGRGYGHGVGMSQYGARGRALDGQSAAAILAHYYRKAVPGRLPSGTRIRVRVLKDFAASATRPLVLYVRATAWTIDGVSGTFPRDARIAITPRTTTADGVSMTTWRLRITDPSGSVLRSAPTTHLRMRGTATGTLFQVWSRPSSYDTYRGVLRAVLDKVKAKANVVNELTVETYLRGVVPAEMPAAWPTEALKAQSIAARSFAARRLRPGVSYYDVSDDTSSQVYLGREAEKATTNGAITATAGVVLKSGTAIANTLFHSAGGGSTEHNENVFVSSTGAKVAGP
ncbi:MAG: SpoIID/LytB domain-containing protein, partial [Candidatus Limnocylindrales bacterium]